MALRITILAVGKIKQKGLRAELDDYLGRIRHYGDCNEVEIKDGSAAEVKTRFDKAIPPRARVVALEVDGKQLPSRGFADWIGKAELDAIPLAFLIGGAYGLPKNLSQAAHLRLSFSAMTFPHRIARVLLAEQLYRAFTILRNEPYDH